MNLLNCPFLAGALALATILAIPARADSVAPLDRATALAEAKAGRWEQAEATLAALAAADPADVEACVCLAQHRLQERRSKEAVALLERAVAVQPERADLRSQLGMALSQRIGEVSFVHQALLAGQMRAAFEKALALDANHVPALLGLCGYFTNAPAVAGGSLEKADTFATTLEKLDPFNAAAAHGQVRERGEKWTEAAAFYRQALALQNQHAGLHAALGRVLARAGQTDEARMAFAAALKLEPDNTAARDGLAALAAPAK